MSKKSRFIHAYKTNLKNQSRKGESKHKNKINQKEECRKSNDPYTQPKGIYSTSTYKTYDETCRSFIKWIFEKHASEVKSYMDCKKFAAEWLQEKEDAGKSAWTINMYASALACSFGGISKSELGYTCPTRERKDVTRNRNNDLNKVYPTKAKRDAVAMFKATGCRRQELLRLRKEDFRKQIDTDGHETGCLEVFKRGKGGIERWCLVNPKYTSFVISFLNQAKPHHYSKSGEERLFKKVDVPAEGVHGYRAIYAKDLYDFYEEKGYANGKLYYCRKELVGVTYDKGILEKVSYDLQHSRNSVVISYLWAME